jgi:hypothetical protein
MNMNEIKAIATKLGIKSGRMKKAELVRAIQIEEGNYDCFGTVRFHECTEEGCLWRTDCKKEAPKVR